jgi:Cu(I)/Ag(I) efflux system membrane fusion protein
MHPQVVMSGLDSGGAVPRCPICGMPLVKRKKGEAAPLPPGVVARVQVSPHRVQFAGIRTAEVEWRPLARELRTVGFVTYDESRLARIVARVAGYVEKLHVNKTFDQVETGQVLAEVYSPSLYSASEELLIARRTGSEDLVQSGREKLELLGVAPREIDAVLAAGQSSYRMAIRSPQAGHVIGKPIVEGSRIDTGSVLFEVADLSAVWVEAEVYEKDLPFVREGQTIEATVESLPGRVFRGRVALVHPHLEPQTRTNRVRFEIENPGHALRPGMYAAVNLSAPVAAAEPFRSQLASLRKLTSVESDEALAAIQKLCPVTGRPLGSMGKPLRENVPGGSLLLCCAGCQSAVRAEPEKYLARLVPPDDASVLAVPEEAVIDTGTHKVVYVEREPGLFEAIEVTTGPPAGGYYPVLSGILAGDRVAAAGAFLIDAETRINPDAGSTFFGASGSGSSSGAHSGHGRGAP